VDQDPETREVHDIDALRSQRLEFGDVRGVVEPALSETLKPAPRQICNVEALVHYQYSSQSQDVSGSSGSACLRIASRIATWRSSSSICAFHSAVPGVGGRTGASERYW